MVDSFPPFVVSLAAMGVVGFVAWAIASIINNRIDLHKLELKISQDYVKKDAFEELRREVIKEFRVINALMNKIAGKLGIEINRE